MINTPDTSTIPAYFEEVRRNAAQIWGQLEHNPELAAPWHQLFKQVQSPRHVLSELLQNADDAGATEAVVRIEGGVFIFEHNGEDFAPEHFASLCRFGYSNKRALHTIGFRGIGFKSTFSLGDTIELMTPTLAVAFHRARFTEPHWQAHWLDLEGMTRVSVKIADHHRQRELEKNFGEWLNSPLSLLFFKHIRRLMIGGKAVHWGSMGPGPIPHSEWMARYGHEEEAFLLVRSPAEPFPAEALAEINQERMPGVESDTEFPPCSVELVMGAEGRLFVVLPTGVETELPFACNAPFIQDPARLKIKDPEISPTNRWLLERAGRLAADAMLAWLARTELPTIERVGAYGLFPDVNRENSSLEGLCGAIAELSFADAIVDQPLLLTEDGALADANQSVWVPQELYAIWPADQITNLFDEARRPPLCRYIEQGNREALQHWGLLKEIDKAHVLQTLQQRRLPQPQTWHQLLLLWAYIAPEITSYRRGYQADAFNIVPVQGKQELYPASKVVRLGEKKLLQNTEDWEFLAAHLLVLNQNWPRFLAEQQRALTEADERLTSEAITGAYAVLQKLGLADTSDLNRLVNQIAHAFFSQKEVLLRNCVRLAHIAAKLNVTIGEAFRYVTQDRRPRSVSEMVLFDQDGKLEDLLPLQMRASQFLHHIYTEEFVSCSREEWLRWVTSGRSGLSTFVRLEKQQRWLYRRQAVEQETRRRGYGGVLQYPYVTNKFVLEDWNYASACWDHWASLAADDPQVWVRVIERILQQRDEYWSRARSARILQIATTGSQKGVAHDLLPGWVLRLRELPCLPDTRGVPRKPADLLRRTPQTEALLDVELFVAGQLDNEANRPLLDLLRVQSTPTGPGRLLDRLRALAKAERPPALEVDKWYRRLDQLLDTCSTIDSLAIRKAFSLERIILTADGAWERASAVFLSADEEDVPGVAVVRPSVRELTLWRKVGVAERATAELAITWLKGLPSGTLSSADARRVRALLVRYAGRIWDECGRWLNLAGEWAPISGLQYALTMQSLIPWSHLHPWVKQKTADLQRLSREVTGAPPFAKLPPLAQYIEERFKPDVHVIGQSDPQPWLTAAGEGLQRVKLDSVEETDRIRRSAARLAATTWHVAQVLETIPYLEGQPAGTPRQTELLWFEQRLYVTPQPKARLARRVPEELGATFGRDDVKSALIYSFGRSPQDVLEYLAENFDLAEAAEPMQGASTIGPPGVTAPTALPTPPAPEPVEPTSPFAQQPGEATHDEMGAQRTAPRATPEPDRGRTPKPPGPGAATPPAPLGETVSGTSGPQQPGATPPPPAAGLPPQPPTSQPPASQPPAPQLTLIDRFARGQGFQKAADGRYVHADGSWIGRANGDAFPWQRRDKGGQLMRYYLPVEQCIEHEPLSIAADRWSLLEHKPDIYALIVLSPAGESLELTGARLCILRDGGSLTLYPAAYRLVYSHDHD